MSHKFFDYLDEVAESDSTTRDNLGPSTSNILGKSKKKDFLILDKTGKPLNYKIVKGKYGLEFHLLGT